MTRSIRCATTRASSRCSNGSAQRSDFLGAAPRDGESRAAVAVVVDDAAVALEPHAAAAERAQADFDFADFDAGDAEVLAADVEDPGGVRGARREVVAGLVGAAEDGVVLAGDGVGERGLVHERGGEIELVDDEHLPAVRLDFAVVRKRARADTAAVDDEV